MLRDYSPNVYTVGTLKHQQLTWHSPCLGQTLIDKYLQCTRAMQSSFVPSMAEMCKRNWFSFYKIFEKCFAPTLNHKMHCFYLLDRYLILTFCIIHRTFAIITRGLYTFYPIFEGQKRFFKELFCKILTLCMVSIQERFQNKSGL